MTKKLLMLSIFLILCLTTVSILTSTAASYDDSNFSSKQKQSTKEQVTENNLNEEEDSISKEKYKNYSDYYIDRVTTFSKMYHDKNDIIFLGDSLIDICEWNELFRDSLIKNRGISGDTTTGVLDRLGEVIKGKPQKVFIMIGINDIGKGRSTIEIINNYEKILKNIKESSLKTEIYVHSVLPINRDLFKTTTKDEEIISLNNELKKICEKHNVQYIDLYSYLVQPDKKLKLQYTTGGIHLNGKGYLVWKEVIKEFI